MSITTDVLVIGAGLSGLSAASRLEARGARVLVVDKARGVGGRMATRRIGSACFDHGAQFMTVRDTEFARSVSNWAEAGIVAEWFSSADGRDGRRPRLRGNPAMTAIAKELSRTLNVRLETRISHLSANSHWIATADTGDEIVAGTVVLTPPVPQSLALLEKGATKIPGDVLTSLKTISYERCIAVMAVLGGRSAVPEPGWVAPSEGPVAWIADNQTKGVSEVPAITIHADAVFSRKRWDDDRKKCGKELLEAAGAWIGSPVTDFQVHGWRYSKPRHLSEQRYVATRAFLPRKDEPGLTGPKDSARTRWESPAAGPVVVFAGDAFGGPRIEGAFLSGAAAADYLRMELGQ